MTKFGELERVDLYEAWSHEAREFTPWLAENLDRLSEAIGIPLDFEGREVGVGRFRADIVATNAANGSRVVIENQLDRSDNKHLGQVMTYMTGVDGAETVVWIARGFDESHLSAVRWLNKHTEDPFAFLAVRVQVKRIAGSDSPMVPIFKIVEGPNNWDQKTSTWDREMREIAQPEVGSLTRFRQDFWTHYAERYPDDGVAPGRGASSFWVRIASADLILAPYLCYHGVGVWVRGEKKESPDQVRERIQRWSGRLREQLRVRIGEGTPWGSFAGRYLSADMRERDNWPDASDWLHRKIVGYREVFEGWPDEDADEPNIDEPE